MADRRGHPQRFPEATIWLTCAGTLAALCAAGIVWDRGQDLAAELYPMVRVGDAIWPLTSAWFIAAVLAGLSVAFMLGRSLRLGMALATGAAVVGLVGIPFAGRWVDTSWYTGHLLFGDPTRKWQFLLLWLVPAALLLTAATLAVIDARTGVRRHPPDPGTRDPRTPTAGNEGLHWPGSTYAGIDAQSNARERY
ncbi:MAG TPA: hypothetical protein VK576_04570 [Thermoleophilia bacterium]|nr:hypothetical protein [Thermoleophilia bacterium]